MKKAIILLSGGLDSTTCLYWAKNRGYQLFSLVFDYGQRHKKEIRNAVKIAQILGTHYEIVQFVLPWGRSALIKKEISLPKERSLKEVTSGKIPVTYVPARNTIFLSFALSFADAIGGGTIVIGANAVDFSGYPDCRPRYIDSMQKVAWLGTKSGSEGKKIEILAPLIKMPKAEIIKLGLSLKVPYQLTWSCYRGERKPCRKCDSCILREKGFMEAGELDPLLTLAPNEGKR